MVKMAYDRATALKIRDFLASKGLTTCGVYGMMANIYTESGFRADNAQNSYMSKIGMTDAEYTQKVDSGEYTNFVNDKVGYGLVQWTSAGRKQGLLNYARNTGKSIGNEGMQLEYLMYELSTAYKSTFDFLKTSNNIRDCAKHVMTKFERPADQSEAAQNNRADYGEQLYKDLENKEQGCEMKLKICLDAGHGVTTPGKRCDARIDTNTTREWTLNSRIANKLGLLLKAFDCEVMRVDDVTGASDVTMAERVKKANDWKADVYISIHHDAGVDGQAGGGTTVYYNSTKPERQVQAQSLYNNVVGLTGLKGNRYYQIINKGFYVIHNTTMPAFLIENGFMDSSVDTPIILTESHADKTARGILNFLVSDFKLTRKADVAEEKQPEIKQETSPAKETANETVYRVQVGAFGYRENAETMLNKLKSAGFTGYITETKK